MTLHAIDYLIIVFFFVITLAVGWFSMKRAGKDSSEFFLSGRTMPWWLLGFSMVATTFSAGTPNLVTDIVRQHGIAGNWIWWAFLLTGMLTVFVYAKLWRRLGVMTDIEFYEVRYSGKVGAFLRGFRTLYLGFLLNTVIMASATLAMIKILGVMFGVAPIYTILGTSIVTVIFSACGGFTAVLWTDLILFIVAMGGAVATAYVVVGLPEIGGLTALLSHPNVTGSLAFFPEAGNSAEIMTLLVVPFAVLWWSTWYPGSEPGGGSYTAQRMLAAKNESHAIGATLFFNICHYAVRPWPWLLVALASLIAFPTLESLRDAFPKVPGSMQGHDIAYPAMLCRLPSGLSGLVLASLFAAYISTISTHLNLGSSYMVNDWYHRFVKPNATEKQLVLAARFWTVVLMILANILTFYLQNALQVFQILMLIGAGTGLLFLLRWFWWRINAWSEIAAMIFSFIFAVYFKFIHVPLWTYLAPVIKEDGTTGISEAINFSSSTQIVLCVALTTIGWLIVTFLTRPTDEETLRHFLERSRAGGPGWRKVIRRAQAEGVDLHSGNGDWPMPTSIICVVISCVAVYAALFATGFFIYGKYLPAVLLSIVFVVGILSMIPLWKKIV